MADAPDLDGLLAPIAGDDPGGENVRYEPVFDEIKHARQEDPPLPQGEWQRERKVADWHQVVQLASKVLQEQSKDLQVAAWLTEGLLKRQGFGGLHQGLELLRRLHEEQWDHLHPRIEEPDDLEFRAAPLEWVGSYLETAVKSAPLTEAGLGLVDYQQSRKVGYEEDAEKDPSKQEARNEAIQEGKLTAEDFDEAFDATPKAWYKELTGNLSACQEALGQLDEVCSEKYEDVAPSFLTLREGLEEVSRTAGQLLSRKLEKEPDPPEVEDEGGAGADADGEEAPEGAGTPVEAAGNAGGGGSATPSAGSDGRAPAQPRSWEEAAALVATAARFMREESPVDPAPYLAVRGLRWGELRAQGTEVDPRLLSAPATSVRTRLKSLLLDGEWDQLLEAAEEVMATPEGRGWLDLQRYALRALDELGGEYETVARPMRRALQGLLADLPQLPELTLMDDSPAANPETVTWLREEGLVTDANGEGGAAEGDAAGQERPAARGSRDPSARARMHVRAGQPDRAIQLLMEEAAQEESARARFLRRSQAAEIMVQHGMTQVAMPILRELLDRIERHNLEEWEAGETVALPMALLYRCLEQDEPGSPEKDELYLKVCRLDPLQGMRLKGGDGVSAGSGPAASPEPEPAQQVEAPEEGEADGQA